MFGVINGMVAYFIKFPENGIPIMLRTTNKKIVIRSLNCHFQLYKEAYASEKWIKTNNTFLSEEIKKDVELDIQTIYNFSGFNNL
jgi:hypothetical protein